jgi:putative DNA primase/helicase
LKKIISGEPVKVDTKFIPSYDARPFCKIIFSANDMPKIADTSNGIFRRLLLIDFDNVVPDSKIDADLREKVKE